MPKKMSDRAIKMLKLCDVIILMETDNRTPVTSPLPIVPLAIIPEVPLTEDSLIIMPGFPRVASSNDSAVTVPVIEMEIPDSSNHLVSINDQNNEAADFHNLMETVNFPPVTSPEKLVFYEIEDTTSLTESVILPTSQLPITPEVQSTEATLIIVPGFTTVVSPNVSVVTSPVIELTIPESSNLSVSINEQNNKAADLHISDDSDVDMKLVPYSENSDSEVSVELPTKSKTRKKRFQVNKTTWLAEKNKTLREQGRKYLGRSRSEDKWNYCIEKQPRVMKQRYTCKFTEKGRLKCGSVSEIERKRIFDLFWRLTWGEKKILIDTTVSIIPTNRKRNRKEEGSSRRFQTVLYHLRINEENVRVCRVMFLNTICIGRMTVLAWKQKEKDLDRRTTVASKVKVNPFSKDNEELINFIKFLPKMESHYCRASTKKQYLLPEWQSKSSLHKFYINDWCKEKNVSPLSITTFNQALDSENIALFQPKKDQCEKCAQYKVGQVSEIEYNLQINRRNEARMEKEKDKHNEKYVFTLDLQAVLLAPKSQVSSLYYKTKLCVHNMCFYNLLNKDGFCFIWNETEGGLSSEEFASILSNFIIKKKFPEVRTEHTEPIKIILYSDGCTYQNRNVTISNALLNVALTENIIIEQKYLEVGHTQMEADAMHSTIERHLRAKTINVPAEYYGICREARKNPKKFDVTYLDHSFFKKFDKVAFFKSIRPGSRKGDPKVTDLRAIKYDPDGQIQYKLRFDDEWQILPQRQTRGIKYCSFDALEQLHPERLKIQNRKFQDLQSLKTILPIDYHAYYDNIPHE